LQGFALAEQTILSAGIPADWKDCPTYALRFALIYATLDGQGVEWGIGAGEGLGHSSRRYSDFTRMKNRATQRRSAPRSFALGSN
jgi:hypothetical protein